MKKFKAFTLVEILLALAVVGTIAALTAPRLMNNINNRILANKLHGIVDEISYIADEQLLTHNTKAIKNTDFKYAGSIHSHFEKSKQCTDEAPCWAESYKKMSDMTDATLTIPTNAASIRLKNGAVLSYKYLETDYSDLKADPTKKEDWSKPVTDTKIPMTFEYRMLPTFAATTSMKDMGLGNNFTVEEQTVTKYITTYGQFTIDLNGPEAPNVIGKDFFIITVASNGKINSSSSSTLASLKSNCTAGYAAYCLQYLTANNWNMDY
ncbi:MAG: type II secretion system GspH family protein [Muribaculaceae bacterium]|nr:type II secretion system GspH family protein [Muribaculaceae bacterium]